MYIAMVKDLLEATVQSAPISWVLHSQAMPQTSNRPHNPLGCNECNFRSFPGAVQRWQRAALSPAWRGAPLHSSTTLAQQ